MYSERNFKQHTDHLKTINLKSKKFVAYYRVSTSRQGEAGLGIQAQKAMVKSFLKNISPVFSFTEVESGAETSKRPLLLKALSVCEKENAVLVVAKLDRLSRDLNFLTSIAKSRISLICCDMPFANKLTFHLMGALAEWERDQISERTKSALAELKKKGKKLGSRNPKIARALKKWRKTRIIKPVKRKKNFPNLALLAKKYESLFKAMEKENLTLKAQVNKLNALGIPTQRNKKWYITSVVRARKTLNL